jgi:hypothetical protein
MLLSIIYQIVRYQRSRIELHLDQVHESLRLADNGIMPSLGSVGDSYDNALMENFFSTLKIELVYRNSWRTRDEAENALFSHIDGWYWYNTQRIQARLGALSPDEYETAWHAQARRTDSHRGTWWLLQIHNPTSPGSRATPTYNEVSPAYPSRQMQAPKHYVIRQCDSSWQETRT